MRPPPPAGGGGPLYAAEEDFRLMLLSPREGVEVKVEV